MSDAQEFAELKRAVEALKDPQTVHINMLGGGIGRISMTQCAHVWGMTNIDGWHDMTIAELEAAIARK